MKEIIIACHGFAGDKESSAIEALADEMNRNNVGVICFDFPGHGKSEVDADNIESFREKIQLLTGLEDSENERPKDNLQGDTGGVHSY